MPKFVFSFKNFLCLFFLCAPYTSHPFMHPADDGHPSHRKAPVANPLSGTPKSAAGVSHWKCEKLWANEAEFLVFMGEVSTKHLMKKVKIPLLERLSLKPKQSSSEDLLPSPRKPDSRVLFTNMDAMYDVFQYSPDYEKRMMGTKVKEENPVLHLYVKPLLTASEDVLKRRLEGLIDSVVNSHIRTRSIKEVNLYYSYPFYTTEAGLREFQYFFKLMGLLPSHLNLKDDDTLPQATEEILPHYKLNLVLDFPDQKKEFDLPLFFSSFNRSFLKNKALFEAKTYEIVLAEFETKQCVLSQGGKHFWSQLRSWDESLEISSYPGPDHLDMKTNPQGMRISFSIPFPFENTSIPFDPILLQKLGSKK